MSGDTENTEDLPADLTADVTLTAGAGCLEYQYPVSEDPDDPGGGLGGGLGVGQARRLAGQERLSTAVAISQASFPRAGSAGAVVLARGDEPNGYADALAGAPFAVRERAPMLITYPDALAQQVEDELRRVLPAGETVFVLGGPQAISPAIENRIRELGYEVDRIQGPTRIETAVEIAKRLGDPQILMVTTGYNFPDALAAAAAAVEERGAVLLTESERRHPTTDAYLEQREDEKLFAVGGPAARPYTEASSVFGPARIETAVEVADTFFDRPPVAGLAVQSKFPDSLTGGAHVGRLGGPMLLSTTDQLHPATAGYLCRNAGTVGTVFVYGGEAVIANPVRDAAAARARGESC